MRKNNNRMSPWHFVPTLIFILIVTEEFQWLVLTWSTSVWHIPLVLNTNFSSFCSLEGPKRREWPRAWEQIHLERRKIQREAYPGPALFPHPGSRSFEKSQNLKITKAHHLSAGKEWSCVNKYFPSDRVLNAKDTQMIMTKFLFNALCA